MVSVTGGFFGEFGVSGLFFSGNFTVLQLSVGVAFLPVVVDVTGGCFSLGGAPALL